MNKILECTFQLNERWMKIKCSREKLSRMINTKPFYRGNKGYIIINVLR